MTTTEPENWASLDVTINGASDDTIEVRLHDNVIHEFSAYPRDGVFVASSDLSVHHIQFTNEGEGVWRITQKQPSDGPPPGLYRAEDIATHPELSGRSDVLELNGVTWIEAYIGDLPQLLTIRRS